MVGNSSPTAATNSQTQCYESSSCRTIQSRVGCPRALKKSASGRSAFRLYRSIGINLLVFCNLAKLLNPIKQIPPTPASLPTDWHQAAPLGEPLAETPRAPMMRAVKRSEVTLDEARAETPLVLQPESPPSPTEPLGVGQQSVAKVCTFRANSCLPPHPTGAYSLPQKVPTSPALSSLPSTIRLYRKLLKKVAG